MPQEMIPPPTFRYVALYDMLADAAFQHRLARGLTEPFGTSRHARASISAAALSVECVANSLIDNMEASKHLRDEIEKLPPLPKLEIALRLKGFSTFNRGRHEVQGAMELIRVRNEFAHPKATTHQAEIHEPKDAGKAWNIPFSIESQMWHTLGIPKQAMMWTSNNSLSVLKVLCSFLQYLFIEVMKAEPHDLVMLLQSRFEVAQVRIPAVFDEVKAEISALSKEGVDFGFLLAASE